jgi:hypothetical protein
MEEKMVQVWEYKIIKTVMAPALVLVPGSVMDLGQKEILEEMDKEETDINQFLVIGINIMFIPIYF